MFTATITSKNFSAGAMQVVVSFSDGVDTIVKAFNISSESDLKNQVRREQSRLLELSNYSKVLITGVYDSSETPPVAPTQAEIDKQTWFRDFGRLESVQRLVTLGAFPVSMQADLDALKTKVQTNFKKAYIADM